MALSKQELQQLAELEEMEALEQRFGATAPASFAIPEQTGKLKSALIGAGQGASFEFGDEILSVLQAAAFNRPYTEIAAENAAGVQEAASTNPMSYYGANIAAGIGFNPAAKAVGAGAKALTKVIPEALALSAPALPKIAQMGIEGATYGGAMGAGAAAPGERIEGALEGAKSGLAIGSVIGAGAEVGSRIAAPFVKNVKTSSIIQEGLEQKHLTDIGLDPTDPETKQKIIAESYEGAKKLLTEQLPEARLGFGKEMTASLDRASQKSPDAVVKIDQELARKLKSFSTLAEQAGVEPAAFAKDRNKIVEILNEYGILPVYNGEISQITITPSKAANLRQEISRILSDNGPLGLESRAAKGALKEIESSLDSQIKDILIKTGEAESYGAAKQGFTRIADTTDKLGVPAFFNKDQGAIESSVNSILGKVSKLSSDTSLTGESLRRQVEDLRTLLKELETDKFKAIPENVRQYVADANKTLDRFEDLSQARQMSKEAGSRTPLDSHGQASLGNSLRSNVMRIYGALLKTPQAISEASSAVITPQGTKFVGKTLGVAQKALDVDTYFKKIAELAEKTGNTKLSETLKSISQQDMQKRRAMTFVLMQQPAIRKMLNEEQQVP